MPSHPKKPRSKKQAKKTRSPDDDFLTVARRLECDEDKGRFEAKLGRVAKAKPKISRL
jgi:hypothetical protein